ncbi:uncharacterized protein KY384_006859 [Bacidia gigantensis]|uniref:uncharacterized protein n=1 Tax=Bacidia gigantensis TaxID=2732470 RepID=UPI001D04FC21|nr:uncharacterized protein KY384_006859 [Bacidia gigantensis]KAG8527943.1 hypothetical protein KY384_006859 [Bacidia gigantensis]
MASNILFLPFRRSHSTKISPAIGQYISSKYDQHPGMFRQDMEDIDKLRLEAVNSLEAHVSGIRKLTAYAAQLVMMGGKFPIDIGVDFTWYPALGFNTQRPVSQNNLRFELANVLGNLSALYTQLAVSLNWTTSDGLKSACNYFCQAAGVISYIKENVIPDMRGEPPEDMDIMTMESIQQLFLAQGQECFWSKAVKDGMSDGTIAKLAAKVSDFYDQAAEYGTKSDIISTEWIHHMTAKHHHFAAAAQYRASRECLEKQNYGEEVARLRDSLVCANEALKEARWINKMVLGDVNGLKAKVSDDLKRAEKDNDVIYLMPVPPKSELKTLGRAGMATARIPEEVSNPASTLGKDGQPLFTRLVPYAVHVAASLYEERKNRMVNNSIVDELESLTNQLRDLLASLNLPGSLQALERPLGLPPSLTSHAEEIRQQGGLHKIRKSLRDIARLKESDLTIYQEGVNALTFEADEDERAKSKYGTQRWTRHPSKQAAQKLYSQLDELKGFLASAASSDELIGAKLKDCEKVVQVMEGTTHDIEEFVPSSRRTTRPPEVEHATIMLREMLNEVSHIESRRKKSVAKIKEKAKYDDINNDLLLETARLEREFPMQKIEPANFEDLFQERLDQYDEDQERIKTEASTQKRLMTKIKEANSAFANARKGDTSTREREKALQQLENAYVKYKEIIANMDTGRKFYNDLAKIVTRFRDDSKKFAYQRRVDANQLEGELENAMSALNLDQTNALNEQKQRDALRTQYSSKAPPTPSEPLAAPLPQRANVQPPPAAPPAVATAGMWNPEMGIKFGQAQGGNLHNPAYPQTKGRPGPWDMSQGVRFG